KWRRSSAVRTSRMQVRRAKGSRAKGRLGCPTAPPSEQAEVAGAKPGDLQRTLTFRIRGLATAVQCRDLLTHDVEDGRADDLQRLRRCRTPDPTASHHRPRRLAPGNPPGEQAPAQERSLQSPVAVHAAAAEARRLAGGEKAPDGLPVLAQGPGRQVGLDA